MPVVGPWGLADLRSQCDVVGVIVREEQTPHSTKRQTTLAKTWRDLSPRELTDVTETELNLGNLTGPRALLIQMSAEPVSRSREARPLADRRTAERIKVKP